MARQRPFAERLGTLSPQRPPYGPQIKFGATEGRAWERPSEAARGRFPLGGGNDGKEGVGMTRRGGGNNEEKVRV